MLFLEIEKIIINLNHVISIQKHPQDSTKVRIEMLNGIVHVFTIDYEKLKDYLNYVLPKDEILIF